MDSDPKILFVVPCPAIDGRMAILTKDLWIYKIVARRPFMRHKLELVKKIIQLPKEQVQAYQKKSDPKKICLQKEVPDFLPYNEAIRIALKLSTDGKTAEVVSAYDATMMPSKKEAIQYGS